MKPLSRPYSQYGLEALQLLGHLIREARIQKGLTTTELSERAGISRTLLQRIERGDPGCSIGAVFEVAALTGVPIFEQENGAMTTRLALQETKMPLLPKSVRVKSRAIKDDF